MLTFTSCLKLYPLLRLWLANNSPLWIYSFILCNIVIGAGALICALQSRSYAKRNNMRIAGKKGKIEKTQMSLSLSQLLLSHDDSNQFSLRNSLSITLYQICKLKNWLFKTPKIMTRWMLFRNFFWEKFYSANVHLETKAYCSNLQFTFLFEFISQNRQRSYVLNSARRCCFLLSTMR